MSMSWVFNFSFNLHPSIILMITLPGNGFIPTSSLREILGALDDQLTNDQLNEMIAEIDTDDSGTVDFDGEFGMIKKIFAF